MSELVAAGVLYIIYTSFWVEKKLQNLSCLICIVDCEQNNNNVDKKTWSIANIDFIVNLIMMLEFFLLPEQIFAKVLLEKLKNLVPHHFVINNSFTLYISKRCKKAKRIFHIFLKKDF